MGVARESQCQQTAVHEWAAAHLSALGDDHAGWSVTGVTWRERDLAVLRLHHHDLGAVAIELFEEPSERAAFARGPRYAASTRRGPGLLDVGAPTTPDRARLTAYALCSALAAATTGPVVSQESLTRVPAPPPRLTGEELAHVLRGALALGEVPGLERWSGPRVGVMTRWGEVAEVEYTREGNSLVFIVSPRDDSRSTFVRGHAYELVYYSDDLAPEEHEALYARDTDAIESFARWFRSWDRSHDPA